MRNFLIPLFFAAMAAFQAGGGSSTLKTHLQYESRKLSAKAYEEQAEKALVTVHRWKPQEYEWARKRADLYYNITLLNFEASRLSAEIARNGSSSLEECFQQKLAEVEATLSATIRDYDAWKKAQQN